MAMNPPVGVVELHHVPRIRRRVGTAEVPYRRDEEHTVPTFNKQRLSWLAVPSLFIGLWSAPGKVRACDKLRRSVQIDNQ